MHINPAHPGPGQPGRALPSSCRRPACTPTTTRRRPSAAESACAVCFALGTDGAFSRRRRGHLEGSSSVPCDAWLCQSHTQHGRGTVTQGTLHEPLLMPSELSGRQQERSLACNWPLLAPKAQWGPALPTHLALARNPSCSGLCWGFSRAAGKGPGPALLEVLEMQG